MEQTLHRTLSDVESDENTNQKNNKKPSSPATDTANGCFDCNICLDSAHEPVVTLCGHLYCWPCIYKWLHVQSYSDDVDNEPKCPVCKSKISQSSLVPLYGRGTSSGPDHKRPQFGTPIPRRPPPVGLMPHQHQNEPVNTNHFQHNPYSNYPSSFGNAAMSSAISPTVGMFGEMMFSMFGSDTGIFHYPYANNYFIGGPNRIRRQEMRVDKSLNRVSIFLFCCFILCLLLF